MPLDKTIGGNSMKKYQCPCCEFYTLEHDGGEGPLFEICKVCFWQYDPVMHDKHSMAGGANVISLDEAKINYQKYGAAEQRFINYVRKPKDYEIPNGGWK